MRILLDTNILFSALGYSGNERTLLFELIDIGWEILITDRILEELQVNIRKKYTSPQKEKALDLLLTFLRLGNIEVKGSPEYEHNLKKAKTLINEKDAMILAAAILEDIDILVTGDKHFLDSKKLKASAKVTVKKTVEILDMLTQPDREN